MVGYVVRVTPRIYATQEDQQAYHQATMVQVEGKIAKQSIIVLIDPGSSHNYATPRILNIVTLRKRSTSNLG